MKLLNNTNYETQRLWIDLTKKYSESKRGKILAIFPAILGQDSSSYLEQLLPLMGSVMRNCAFSIRISYSY